MSRKIIVCVTTQGAIGALFEHGALGPCQNFPATEGGARDFASFLGAHPGVPVYVMVDSVEEDYRIEILPHVSGPARSELVQRKLRQLYRSTPYCTAWIQGREADKRRDDRYLFAALTNVDLPRPWLDALNDCQAPLAGIYLLPMVSQELLGLLKLTQPDVLVVSKHFDSLRQSFFQGGQLKVSRLAVVGADNAIASLLLSEITKTRLYLNSLRLTARDAQLAVLLLDPSDSMEELQQRLQADASFSCQRMTRQELSARLKSTPVSACPYTTHMTVLGLHPPSHHLAPPGATRMHWRYRQRKALYGTAAIAAAISFIWGGANLFQQYQVNEDTRQLASQTQLQQARYAEVTKTFPASPTSAEGLEKAVRIAELLKQDAHTPERMMQIVSGAMESSPEIVLMYLGWKYGVPGEKMDGARTMEPSASNGRQEWGVLEAEIRPFHGDYRAAMMSIERFAEKLKRDPEVSSASVIQMPLNVHSTSALSGNTLDTASTDSVRAEFKIKLVLGARK